MASKIDVMITPRRLMAMYTQIKNMKPRSAWGKGVQKYALELMGGLRPVELGAGPYSWSALKKAMLNGARDWKEYSYGGMALVYNQDIAKRLSTASEYKATKGGMKEPNPRESWLDVQARALHQACELIRDAYNDNSPFPEFR